MQSTLAMFCRYSYDGLDQLTHQHQPESPTHQRFYCNSRLTTEIHGTLRHSIIQHDDLLLAEQRHEGSSTDTTLLATDLQRSVLNSLKQGIAPQPITYTPYGHRPALGGLLSLLGFNGERPDPLTGHYLLGNGYRAFNPVLMRFNSPDSMSPFGRGGINTYAYCSGDPTNSKDPTGHYGQLLSSHKALKHIVALDKTGRTVGYLSGIPRIEKTVDTRTDLIVKHNGDWKEKISHRTSHENFQVVKATNLQNNTFTLKRTYLNGRTVTKTVNLFPPLKELAYKKALKIKLKTLPPFTQRRLHPAPPYQNIESRPFIFKEPHIPALNIFPEDVTKYSLRIRVFA